MVTLLLALFGVLAVSTVQAAPSDKEAKISKRTLAKYDTNKDGKLSEEEKAVWDADKAKAKLERQAKKDAKNVKDTVAEPAAK
jgi:hypothetical protein